MTNKKRGRPARIKGADLKQAGFKYKLEHLTQEEKEERQNGRKMMKDGKMITMESTDYDYFYKNVDNVEVRLYYVNKDFFYKNVRLTSLDQLPLIEKDALANAHYAELDKQVQDTRPVSVLMIKNNQGSKQVSCYNEDEIILIGGPLHEKIVNYSTKFPFYMEQFEVTHAGTNPPAKSYLAARYKRNKENPNIYNYDPSI